MINPGSRSNVSLRDERVSLANKSVQFNSNEGHQHKNTCHKNKTDKGRDRQERDFFFRYLTAIESLCQVHRCLESAAHYWTSVRSARWLFFRGVAVIRQMKQLAVRTGLGHHLTDGPLGASPSPASGARNQSMPGVDVAQVVNQHHPASLRRNEPSRSWAKTKKGPASLFLNNDWSQRDIGGRPIRPSFSLSLKNWIID